MTLILAFVVVVLIYAAVSRRLDSTIITAPMLFTAAGAVVLLLFPSDRELQMKPFRTISELALVLILFAGASRTDLNVLKSIRNLPTRLLTLGMLLTIALGTMLGRLIFPSMSIWEAGILSAILAPTDAGLGMVIVNSPRVPLRIRQALNVEAGLNDGLAVPFLLFFIAMAHVGDSGTSTSLLRFINEQLCYGVLVGSAVGFLGGRLLSIARKAGWCNRSQLYMGIIALPALCLLVSEHAGASTFIAAFVAGLAFQLGLRDNDKRVSKFTEQVGHLLGFSVFFLFGMLATRLRDIPVLTVFVYAVLSLTLVRLVPVLISLIGTDLPWSSKVFMGWFGPRGLASIVLGLVYLEHEPHLPAEPTISATVLATVLLSIFAHGATALPGIRWHSELHPPDELEQLPQPDPITHAN